MQYNQYRWSQPVNGLVSVTGINGAKAYQLPPNSAMPLFDVNEDILYVKTTDGAGFPTIRVFDFTERVEVEQDTSQFATKADLEHMAEKIIKTMKGANHGEQLVRAEIIE